MAAAAPFRTSVGRSRHLLSVLPHIPPGPLRDKCSGRKPNEISDRVRARHDRTFENLDRKTAVDRAEWRGQLPLGGSDGRDPSLQAHAPESAGAMGAEAR